MPENHLLAIPVFNEERYVSGVIEQAKQFSRHILVVDDGSTDRTGELLREHGTVFFCESSALSRQPVPNPQSPNPNPQSPIRNPQSFSVITHLENRGYGKSLADAFAFAQRCGYRWLITMDCDEQHEASYIPFFLEVMAHDDADIISGTRYPNGHDVDGSVPPDRREINRRITAMLNRRLGLSITDAFCGFKAYRVSALRHINITVPGYAMPMQFWVQVVRANLRVRELPVRLIYNDPARHFGGILDDPSVRLSHYLEVLEAELAADPVAARAARSSEAGPCTETVEPGTAGPTFQSIKRQAGKPVPHPAPVERTARLSLDSATRARC